MINANMKKMAVVFLLTVFVLGIFLSSADAASFTCKGDKEKIVGQDKIVVSISNKVNSEDGRSVRVNSGNKKGGASHQKLDKLTVKYKVGKKTYTKSKKLAYNNDYKIKMPKGFKVCKVTVKYHKASAKEYKKLKANWAWD